MKWTDPVPGTMWIGRAIDRVGEAIGSSLMTAVLLACRLVVPAAVAVAAYGWWLIIRSLL